MLPIDLGNVGHPYTTDWLRYALARRTLLQLVLIFVALLVLISFVLGAAYRLTLQPGESTSLVRWWHEAFMMLTTIPLNPGVAVADDWSRRIVQAVAATAGLVLPALFLGSIVFKLLLAPDVFVFRKHLALIPNPPAHDKLPADGRHLAIRVYSSTRLELLDLRAAIVLRIRSEVSGAGAVAKFRDIELVNPSWPLGEMHLPHTLRVLLEDDDTEEADGEVKLKKIRGNPVKDGDSLIIQISGATPDLGTTFVESHTFDLLACVSTTQFAPIDPKPGVKLKDLDDWKHFDE